MSLLILRSFVEKIILLHDLNKMGEHLFFARPQIRLLDVLDPKNALVFFYYSSAVYLESVSTFQS